MYRIPEFLYNSDTCRCCEHYKRQTNTKDLRMRGKESTMKVVFKKRIKSPALIKGTRNLTSVQLMPNCHLKRIKHIVKKTKANQINTPLMKMINLEMTSKC